MLDISKSFLYTFGGCSRITSFMKRFLTKLTLSIAALITLTAGVYCAPPVPSLDAVQNYNGPIVMFWGANGAPASTLYTIFIATNSLASMTTTQMLADPLVAKINDTMDSNLSSNYVFTNNTLEQTYYVRMASYDGLEYSSATPQSFAVSRFESPVISSITTKVNRVESTLVDYEKYDNVTSSIKYYSNMSPSPKMLSGKVIFDVLTNEGVTVLTEPVEVALTVTVSSSNYHAVVEEQTWDCSIHGHRHNGTYKIAATPYSSNNTSGAKLTKSVSLDVVHINGATVNYNTVGTSTIHYGPPFTLQYYLSKAAFVTAKIYDRHQNENPLDDTLIRTISSNVPRVIGDTSSYDTLPSYEVWDGRNDSGAIVGNNIYRIELFATSAWDNGDSGFDLPTVDSHTVNGLISFDVLRLIDVSAAGITDTNSLAHIRYTLAGANSLVGGATVKIVICNPGTSFTMATTSGTLTYAGGTSTYTYVAGDPIPSSPATNLKRVFVFARNAGALDETWNGCDSLGKALVNDNYVFAISATDDSGNHAIDNSGNDRLCVGNISIDRTTAETSVDSTPPTVTSISVGGTGISMSGGSILTQSFLTVAVTMADTGGSGVDLANSVVTLTGPTTNTITVTTSNDSVNTITLTCASQQSLNGNYIVRVRPKDLMGNTASDSIVNFTLATASSDTQAPAVTSILVGGVSIAATGTTLTQSFETLSVTLTDAGGAGVDLTGTTITLVDPSTTTPVVTTATNNGSNIITLTFIKQSTDGVYTITVTPKDKVGNTGAAVPYRFTLTLNANAASQSFEESVHAYPNPAKGVDSVTIVFTSPKSMTAKLEIYTLRGELVFEESFAVTASSAEQPKTWSLVNSGGSKLATGVYLYRLFDVNSTSKSKKLKKIIIIQ